MRRQLRSGSPAPGGFDLDHVGAELAEGLAGERAGDELAHLDDAQAVQRARRQGRVCSGHGKCLGQWIGRDHRRNVATRESAQPQRRDAKDIRSLPLRTVTYWAIDPVLSYR